MEVVTEEDPPEVIETLEKCDFFGEIFLIHACPQKMSLRAVTHVDMLILSKGDLDALLVHDVNVAAQVSEVADRLYASSCKIKWKVYLNTTINPLSLFTFLTILIFQTNFLTILFDISLSVYSPLEIFCKLTSLSLASHLLYFCMNNFCVFYELKLFSKLFEHMYYLCVMLEHSNSIYFEFNPFSDTQMIALWPFRKPMAQCQGHPYRLKNSTFGAKINSDITVLFSGR